MRVLQVHNKYQNPGGEDVVVASEHDLLKGNGHDVYQWIVHNDAIKEAGAGGKMKIAMNSIWSRDAQKEITAIINEFKPDIAHIHNTIPLLSPSIYSACHKANVPVVQTLHNYRTVCPASPLYRDNHICTECLGKLIPYPAMVHGCYRDSKVQSAFSVASLSYNRMRGTYRKDVDLYISLTEFARDKFIEGGMPGDKIVVKPNFVTTDIEQGTHDGGYAFFAGRLVPHKGVATLINAWKQLEQPIPLKIAGQGPMENILQDLPQNIEYLGQVSRDEVFNLMRNANFVIFPSEWYETFGLAVVEAFATAAPVIVSKIGGLANIVEDGESGWHFTPGDAKDLAEKVQQAWSDPAELKRRGRMARQRFEEYYTPEKNYGMLLEVYQSAISRFKQHTATN